MRKLPLLSLAFLTLALALSGCVSPAFRAAAPISLLWTEQARAYLVADKTLADDVHAQRLADITTLEQAVSSDSLTVDSVDSSWQRFRGWYLAYIAGDTNLDSAAKQLRVENASRFDRLIAAERSRVFGVSGGATDAPVSVPAVIHVPTTSPSATDGPPAPTP